MAQAKTISSDQLLQLLDFITKNSETPLRDMAVVVLSFKSGLRIGEISSLRWRNVLNSDGTVADSVEVPANISKSKRHRYVPMHPAVKISLEHLRARTVRGGMYDPIILGRDHDWISAKTLQRYISRLYVRAGFVGVSTHSGRRTFITQAARKANQHGCSLKDVQRLAGHSDLSTTEAYIDYSENTPNLVNAL